MRRRSLRSIGQDVRGYREIRRLESIPRRTSGVSGLLGPSIEFVDAASFLAQYRQLFKQDVYAFPSSGAPSVIDAGANIGMTTLAVKRRFPNAQIVAFEADPVIAEVARRNVHAAQLSDVEVISAAIATSNTTLRFEPDGADGGHLASVGSLEVPAVRLRDRLEALDRDLDLLKLDIEGAEVDVLLDCADVLDRVAHLAFEHHSFVGRPQRLGLVLTALEEAGFRLAVREELAPSQPFLDDWSYQGMDLQLNVWAWRAR